VESLQGQLLLASSDLFDPNFRRTVVLVTAHDEDGAMGLILNRPSEASVAEAVPVLGEVVDEQAVVFAGGPVEPGAVVVLAEWDDPDDAAALVFEDIGFMPADADTAVLEAATRRKRVFAGYAGWGAGQLDAELAADGWIIESARPDDVFPSPEDDLWADVLRRKGGPYALLATMPLDPSSN
jgi:putative transcriptional regulator